LNDYYQLRCLGEIKWFLGIRIVRDRPTRRIWLLQDQYIKNVCEKYGITLAGKAPEVPIKVNYLEPSTEEPSPARTKLYQELVGKLAYSTTMVRPDVARAHTMLARHLTNPGQSHVAHLYGVWRYLL